MSMSLVCVGIIGIGDFLTGSEIALSLFYLLPVGLVTWSAGRMHGLVISMASSGTMLAAALLSHDAGSSSLVYYWRAIMHFGFFMAVVFLLPALKALEYEKMVARIDYLTGVSNRRHFFEKADDELRRSKWENNPVTVAFIDLDGFKAVNDRFGHAVGDELLCAVVESAKVHLRKTDTFARMGGDEFVLLLPGTAQDSARVIIPRIRDALKAEMEKHLWPVTFSLGVITCHDPSIDADELVKRADELMYSVKRNGKNAIAFELYQHVADSDR